LGALEDERVAREAERGTCVVNVGNQHTLALLVRGEELFGVVEHHTESMTTEKLERLVARLVAGAVTHEEVFDDDGHGALVLERYAAARPFHGVSVTGPNRAMAKPLDWYFAAPHGAMMLSGCFGLIRGVREMRERSPRAAAT
ncbi:MAG: pyruvate formate lyase-activating protein, partial [Chloroflexota bacterium]|nr:pyruvate formate lyase-activating protein [Chloroflexota bacterium]